MEFLGGRRLSPPRGACWEPSELALKSQERVNGNLIRDLRFGSVRYTGGIDSEEPYGSLLWEKHVVRFTSSPIFYD